MVATAAVLVALGRRLGSLRVGVAAGLLLAVAPLTSRYGQEGRPYALAVLAATVAAHMLVRATEPDARHRAWAGYAAAVVATGLANVLALLVLAGHGAFVLISRRTAARSWAASAGGALVVLSPSLVASSRQAGQVGWLTRPDADDLRSVLSAPFGGLTPPGVLLVMALAVAALRPARIHRAALALGCTWGLLPPLLLWTVSQWHPLFDGRYTVAALPGLCLAVASLADTPHLSPRDHARRTVLTATIVALLAVTGWPAQLRYRDPVSGHGEDVLGAARILTGQARPGDAVLFVPYHLRIVLLMAPGHVEAATSADAADAPADVALGRDAITSATLSGVDVPPAELPPRLAGHGRVWLVTGPAGTAGTAATATGTDTAKVALLARDYVEVRREQVTHFTVTLYERRAR